MLKNHVAAKTGIKAYALFSEAAANTLQLRDLSQPLIAHTEVYEHLGKLDMLVFDLQPVWKAAQERKRTIVSKEEAWVSFEVDIPYPPAVVWEILNTPSLEARVLMLDLAERTDDLEGRLREEAQFHTRLLVTMDRPEPEATEEMRGQFQWMSGLFGNVQSVIEQAIAEGKITTR